MRNAKRALERLTHSFPRNRMTSPITFTLPIRRMLLMINSVAIADALQKLLPVIAIYMNKDSMENSYSTQVNMVERLLNSYSGN